MKCTLSFLVIVAALPFSYSCKKTGNDPHNQNLLKKIMPEIRATISGTWRMDYAVTCGIVCNTSYTPSNMENHVSFLSNDTVKRTINGSLWIYEKATIIKCFDYNSNDSAYAYSMGGGFYLWIMKEIKNDTLIIEDGSQVTMYLTRK